jgi:hypothetical protein
LVLSKFVKKQYDSRKYKGGSMNKLLIKIELLRHVMQSLGLRKGIDHPDVLLISQKLDMLINEYYKRIT